MNLANAVLQWFVPLTRLFSACLALMVMVLARADAKQATPRGQAGKHVTAAGMLLARETPAKAWLTRKQGADVFSGDIVVGMPGAALDSKNGAVRLTLLSDLEGTSPFPVLESAVVLHAAEGADLDFTLDRGRVELANRKDKGSAKVKVH